MNDNLVIKIFNAKDSKKFQTESKLLSADFDFLKPKLIAASENDELLKRSYIIMTFIEGLSLGSVWHKANDVQREKLIAEISKNLKTINKIDPVKINLKSPVSWQDSLFNGSKELTAELQERNIIDKLTADKTVQFVKNNLGVLSDSPLYLVYWDIHFDNFIVNENFELKAMIDLENVELTALDYPLFVIKKMMDEPKKYLREKDEKYARKEDYVQLEEWYRKYYPEMFLFDKLDQRIEIYQLLDILHLMKNWSHLLELPKKLRSIISNS